jgi:hypothetical protein
MAASNDDSATLARPTPTGDHVDKVHEGKCIRTGTFHSRLTLKKRAEM